MRVLFLSSHLPIPANNGQAMRTQSLVRALAVEGHELTFIAFSSPDSPADLKPLSGWCRNVEGVPRRLINMSQGRDVFGRLIALATSKAYALSRFRSTRMRDRIRQHLEEPFDLILADSIYVLINIPQTKIPIALNCHNMEWLILERYANLERNPIKRWYASVEARRIRAFEQIAFKRSSVTMVCSDLERAALHRLDPNLPIVIVPNSVEGDLYSSLESEGNANSPPTLLFQGGMDWYPNREAVRYFIEKVLVLIRYHRPDVLFVVAGRNPPKQFVDEFTALGAVEFTGTIPDMRSYLKRATLVVVPLRIGGGTRLKILEAGAAGKAVVSTRVGAEGLDLQEGKEIILADTPGDFANAVLALLRDNPRLQAVGHRARQKVLASYGFENVRKAVAEMISIVERQRPHRPNPNHDR